MINFQCIHNCYCCPCILSQNPSSSNLHLIGSSTTILHLNNLIYIACLFQNLSSQSNPKMISRELCFTQQFGNHQLKNPDRGSSPGLTIFIGWARALGGMSGDASTAPGCWGGQPLGDSRLQFPAAWLSNRKTGEGKKIQRDTYNAGTRG